MPKFSCAHHTDSDWPCRTCNPKAYAALNKWDKRKADAERKSASTTPPPHTDDVHTSTRSTRK